MSACCYADGMKHIDPIPTPQPLETQTMRELLLRISDVALTHDVENALEQTAKLTALIANLNKTIRETENYNEKLAQAAKENGGEDTLEARLKGYRPTRAEERMMRRELKEHLVLLGPRLFEEDDEAGEHDDS